MERDRRRAKVGVGQTFLAIFSRTEQVWEHMSRVLAGGRSP